MKVFEDEGARPQTFFLPGSGLNVRTSTCLFLFPGRAALGPEQLFGGRQGLGWEGQFQVSPGRVCRHL